MSKLETKSAAELEQKQMVDDIKKSLAEGLAAVDKKTEDLAQALDEVKKSGAGLDQKQIDELKKVSEGAMGHVNTINEEIKKMVTRVDSMDAELKSAIQAAVHNQTKSVDRFEMFEDIMKKSEGVQAFKRGSASAARIDLDRKAAAAMTTGNVSDLLQPERRPGIIERPVQALTIRSLIPAVPVGPGVSTINFVREELPEGGPAMVAETTLKPKTQFKFSQDSETVKTLAHLADASKQILDDAPGLQAFITNRMTYMLNLLEENQLLLGDGTGENLNGLIPNATAYALPAGLVGTNIIQLVDKIRAAKLQARLSFYAPDAVILNPVDVANIELLKDADKLYQFTSWAQGGVGRLWGLRVIESDSIPVGHFLVGAFALAAEIRDREGLSIAFSDTHADNFSHNMITIRVEKRTALVILRPGSFIYGSTTV